VTRNKIEMQTDYWCGNLKERNHLEDKEEDGRMILRYLKGTIRNGVERIHVVWKSGKLRVFVKAAMNLKSK